MISRENRSLRFLGVGQPFFKERPPYLALRAAQPDVVAKEVAVRTLGEGRPTIFKGGRMLQVSLASEDPQKPHSKNNPK